MKLYENIVIGNFLFALGFAIRASHSSRTVCSAVNLLQQTPVDTLLGDLLLEFPGVVRLIEFKAEGNYSGKERARHKLLSSAMDATSYGRVSRAIHWYIETSSSEKSLVARVVPYLDAFPKAPKGQHLEDFIASLAQEVVNPQLTFKSEELRAYLKWVCNTLGNGIVGTGGLLLAAESDGTIHYVPMADLLELRLQHDQLIEFHHQRSDREMEYLLELARGRQQELTLSDPGLVR